MSQNLQRVYEILTTLVIFHMKRQKYRSSRLARLWHTFSNLNLHYHILLIYRHLKRLPYTELLNHFVFKNFQNLRKKPFLSILWQLPPSWRNDAQQSRAVQNRGMMLNCFLYKEQRTKFPSLQIRGLIFRGAIKRKVFCATIFFFFWGGGGAFFRNFTVFHRKNYTVILVIPQPVFHENIKEIEFSTLAKICSIFTNRRS